MDFIKSIKFIHKIRSKKKGQTKNFTFPEHFITYYLYYLCS